MKRIEKSGFRRGEYVGYACGVWRITKSNSSFGNWVAIKGNEFLYAMRLKDFDEKLNDYEKKNTGLRA